MAVRRTDGVVEMSVLSKISKSYIIMHWVFGSLKRASLMIFRLPFSTYLKTYRFNPNILIFHKKTEILFSAYF